MRSIPLHPLFFMDIKQASLLIYFNLGRFGSRSTSRISASVKLQLSVDAAKDKVELYINRYIDSTDSICAFSPLHTRILQ